MASAAPDDSGRSAEIFEHCDRDLPDSAYDLQTRRCARSPVLLMRRWIARLMGVDIPVPDFSTLSRRGLGLRLPAKPRVDRTEPIHLTMDSTLKIFGEGEWLQVNRMKQAGSIAIVENRLTSLDRPAGARHCFAYLTLDHDRRSPRPCRRLLVLSPICHGPISRFLAETCGL